MYRDPEYMDDNLRREALDERRARRQHWCEECRGHTDGNSPCAEDGEDDHA